MNYFLIYLMGMIIAYMIFLNRYLVMKDAINLIKETEPSVLTHDRFQIWTREHTPTLYFVYILTNGTGTAVILLSLVWWLTLPIMFFYWLSKPIRENVKETSKIRNIGHKLMVGQEPYKVVDAFERGKDHPWLEDVPLFETRKT